MKAILILALFVLLLASGCGSGYGNNKKPGGGTTTNSGTPGY